MNGVSELPWVTRILGEVSMTLSIQRSVVRRMPHPGRSQQIPRSHVLEFQPSCHIRLALHDHRRAAARDSRRARQGIGGQSPHGWVSGKVVCP